MPAAAGIQDDGALVSLLTRDNNSLPEASRDIGTPFCFVILSAAACGWRLHEGVSSAIRAWYDVADER
jgi:hypothetical protein